MWTSLLLYIHAVDTTAFLAKGVIYGTYLFQTLDTTLSNNTVIVKFSPYFLGNHNSQLVPKI
jgi:hypothetical protein